MSNNLHSTNTELTNFLRDSDMYDKLSDDDHISLINFVTNYIKNQEAKHLTAIAYAKGYCEGLGKPCEYIEKHYPDLAVRDIDVTNKTN